MKKVIASTVLGLSSFAALAGSVNGVIVDQSGKPVMNGEIKIMGTQLKTKTNDKGEFSFANAPNGELELHIAAPGFVHTSQDINVSDTGVDNLTVTIRNASIEVFDVEGTAFHASNIESAAPISVLAGERLDRQQANTLGDTLANEVGVHSSFHGGVVSTPIIRGLDGPRVLITQNGMDSSDASRVGPDHLVAAEASFAQQVEVLRGPATLFYGSGAIGGVVNVVDDRIPTSGEESGELSYSRNSVNDGNAFSADLTGGTERWAFGFQGFYRDADNYRIPGMAEAEHHDDEHEEHEGDEHDEHDHEEHGSEGRVENSNYESKGFTVGTSYLMDNGHIGFSFERLESLYGIPGHSHGGHGHDEHEGEEHEGEEHEGEDHSEEEVLADLVQDRFQIGGALNFQDSFFNTVSYGISYTDYEHVEIEDGEEGTMFGNDTFEVRSEFLHREYNGWRGGISLHYKNSDFEAIGEEAFTPASETSTFGIGLIEEKHFGDFLVQLGARIERVEIEVPNLIEPDLEFHEHDEEHDDDHGDDHEHDDEHDHMDLDSVDESFTPISLSAGVVWDFADGYNIAASYSRAERAPSAAELFSFGPHIGTGNFEIGALYTLEDDHFEVMGGDFDLEVSNNIDLSFRKFEGDLGVVFNIFYNDISDYYFAANTGLFAEFSHDHDEEHGEEHEEEHEGEEHEHDEEHEGHDEHEDELPVLIFTAADTELYGAELQLNYRLNESFLLKTQGDIIRSRVDTPTGRTELPRTPPARLSAGVEYTHQNWFVDANVRHYFDQDNVAEFEEATDGYTLVELNVSYFMDVKGQELEVFLKGRNLTDEEARVHTSFLKDDAPIAGRGVEFGVRTRF